MMYIMCLSVGKSSSSREFIIVQKIAVPAPSSTMTSSLGSLSIIVTAGGVEEDSALGGGLNVLHKLAIGK